MLICHPMEAKGTNAPTRLKLVNKEIKLVSNTKSLGVMVDEYLDWDNQFKSVKSNVRLGSNVAVWSRRIK